MGFQFNPLRAEFYRQKRIDDETLLIAERKDITPKFLGTLRKKMDRYAPENIHIIIYGPTRDGKSYSAYAIADFCRRYILEKYGEDHEIRHERNESDYLDHVKTADLQDIFIVDEKEEATFQEGSVSELMQMEDVSNICAAKALIVIRLKPQEIMAETAQFILKTHGGDRQAHENRLLVRIREDGEERWIGHVRVPLDPILCEDRRRNIVGTCYFCPKFKQDCQERMAIYERRKLDNIDKILDGSATPRATIIKDLALDFMRHPSFDPKANVKALAAELKLIAHDPDELPHATNRRLVEGEIQSIVALAKKRWKQEHQEANI